VNKIKIGGEGRVDHTEWFACPIAAKIQKCLGTPVKLGADPREANIQYVHHPEYEVMITHPVIRYGRNVKADRYYIVVFEDIEEVKDYKIVYDGEKAVYMPEEKTEVIPDFYNPMEEEGLFE